MQASLVRTRLDRKYAENLELFRNASMHERSSAESQMEASSPEELNVLFEEIASVVEISTRRYAPLLRREANAEILANSDFYETPGNASTYSGY